MMLFKRLRVGLTDKNLEDGSAEDDGVVWKKAHWTRVGESLTRVRMTQRLCSCCDEGQADVKYGARGKTHSITWSLHCSLKVGKPSVNNNGEFMTIYLGE